mgnify:CR=1 FL=1
MNINALRHKISEALEDRQLNCSLVERKVGIPRAALRNFVNGTVKGPKIEMIMAVANFLEIDLNSLPNSNKNTLSHVENYSASLNTNELSSTAINLDLLILCLNALAKSLKKKGGCYNINQITSLLIKIYNFCYIYNNQKLDESFVEWSIDGNS